MVANVPGGTNPIFGAAGAYSPTQGVASNLPGIGSQMDLLSIPLFQNYKAQVDGLDQYNGLLNQTGPMVNPNATFGLYGGMNMQQYYQQMMEMQQMYMQNARQQAEMTRQNTAQINGQMNKLRVAASTLRDKIAQDEQDQIRGALESYIQAAREAYDPDGTMDHDALVAQAMTDYQQMMGSDLISDIRTAGQGSFMNGLLHSVTLGLFGNKTSAEENISLITKQPVSSEERKQKTAGKALGGVALGAGSALAIGAIGAKIGGIAGTCLGPLGTATGAIIGGIIGGIYGYLS